MKHSAAVLGVLMCASLSSGAVVKVPEDHKTIPAAVAAAKAGDTILIAPGAYLVEDCLNIEKKVTIGSNYITSKDAADIDKTIIKGTPNARKQWFELGREAVGSKVIGLTIVGNTRHSLVIGNRDSEVLHCKFIGGKDQLSFEGGGGRIAYCEFDGAGDDAIDADNSIDWIIEHNLIKNAGQDGIEIRLQPRKIPKRLSNKGVKPEIKPTKHVFRYNTVVNCDESGLQIIDYPGDCLRSFEIYGNLFKKCRGSGVSLMADKHTNENYKGSGMVENVVVYNNTFDGCNYGMTMGPTTVVLNNIFTNCKTKGIGKSKFVTLKNDKSIVDHCMFSGNPTDRDAKLTVGKNIHKLDPKYGNKDSCTLSAGSQAIDKGVVTYEWQGVKVLDIPKEQYKDKAPDLGAQESGK